MVGGCVWMWMCAWVNVCVRKLCLPQQIHVEPAKRPIHSLYTGRSGQYEAAFKLLRPQSENPSYSSKPFQGARLMLTCVIGQWL